ncbi:hypothetical protein BDP55DRAFT_635690 [Colletotrichum godetiae]|uniref:Uncharacterized protein n=1 Tax=Colletotrichum godetiae TaxID=1209918 RepID=A0AAJ0ETT5_9PEZI|nr:uncharacterized protein BDP55DRAFT_635690 [Colletotrichum godetiae]KAK1671620.1 hypothetical protein BDP55DRAFT_635690 [Colletotrichum godetiae]
MQLIAQSEWMQDQKQAEVMSPGKSFEWSAIPFDANGRSSSRDALGIDSVYLMTLPTSGAPAGSLTCFVDVLRPQPNTLRLLDRCYITPQSKRAWNKHTLPIDLTSETIQSSLSRRFKDRVGGIYTFGQINGRLELIYAPAFDFWNSKNPPAPARLVVPDNATSIATAINTAGDSHLLFQHQKDGSSGTRIVTTDLVAQVTQLTAEFINGTTALKAGNNTLFTHVTGQQMAQITQDPVTRDWASGSIPLPATDVNDILEISSFTTRLSVLDDSGAAVAKTDILLTATSPDMSAISYKATISNQAAVLLNIDPAEKVKSRIAAIQSGNDLKNAAITRTDGTTSSLIPLDVSQSDCDAAATAIQQLVKVASTLPSDGSPHSSSFANGASVQPAALAQILNLQTPPHQPDARISIIDAVVASSKNIFVQAVSKNFVIRAAKGVYEVLVYVGDAIYRTVLDCVSVVSYAVEWVFTKLKVTFDDLKAFLGFVFNWADIVRTHKVIKNVATKYALYGVSQIGADIPDLQDTAGQSNSKASGTLGSSEPQNYYAQDEAKSNISIAKTTATSVEIAGGSDWASVLEELKGIATAEKDIVKKSLDQINTQIIDPFSGLTPLEIAKRLIAIIGKKGLETAKNIVVKALGIVKDLTSAVIKELNKPISITVISGLYKSIAGEDSSGDSDLQSVTGNTPFPNNASTDAIIEASDFASLRKIRLGNTSVYKNFTIMAEFAAMAGLGFSVITNDVKMPLMAEGKPQKVPDIIKQVSIPIKLMVLMPSFIQPRSDHDSWEIQMDGEMTDLAFLKGFLDATSVGEQELYGIVSPYIDYSISALWVIPFIPSIGKMVANHQKTSSYLSFTTRLAYDVAVMTGPVVWNPDLDPETKLIVLAVSNGIIIVTAGISVATGGLLENDG